MFTNKTPGSLPHALQIKRDFEMPHEAAGKNRTERIIPNPILISFLQSAFSSMKGGVRGKYAGAFDQTAITVLLDSDVAKVFPDSQAVNEALRTLVRVMRNKEEDAQQGA